MRYLVDGSGRRHIYTERLAQSTNMKVLEVEDDPPRQSKSAKPSAPASKRTASGGAKASSGDDPVLEGWGE